MIRSGLVSISFRPLTPAEIVDLSVKAGLVGIEWGGDVHVPHGDVKTAREVRAMTSDAGLSVAAYGSYYRAGETGDDNPDFDAVLACAKALEAPGIRVWCGKRGSAQADATYRKQVTDDLLRIGDLAAREDIRITCEFHGGTLTDTNDSARELFHDLGDANVFPYWQPPVEKHPGYCMEGLQALLPRLVNLHVFYWRTVDGKRERCELHEGEDVWLPFLRAAAGTGRDHWALLEFVRGDSPEQLVRDAGTLNRWLAEL